MNLQRLIQQAIIVTLVTLLLVGCSAPPSTVSTRQPTGETKTTTPLPPILYTDKNGYFSFVPPAGWTRKDYPNEPRSKVEFDCPTAGGVLIRIIAEAASPELTGANIVDVERNQVEKARARLGPTVKMDVSGSTFGGFTAALVRQSIPGQLEQELTIFVAVNVVFNIAYSAPNKNLLEEYRDVAKQSLDTLVVGQKVNLPPGEEKLREDFVARHLRLAQLFASAGDFGNAAKSLEEALQRYPTDTRLQKAMEWVKQKKPIPDNLDSK